MPVLDDCRIAIATHYADGSDMRPTVLAFVAPGKVSLREWNGLIAEVHGQLGNPAGNTAVIHEPPAIPVSEALEGIRAARKQRLSRHVISDPPHIGHGPGTELTAIFAAARIPSCQRCKELAARMDRWSAAGCQEHKAEIVAELNERATQFGWAKKFEIGARLAAMGLVLNPLDPMPGLVERATQLAETKAR